MSKRYGRGQKLKARNRQKELWGMVVSEASKNKMLQDRVKALQMKLNRLEHENNRLRVQRELIKRLDLRGLRK
jgi:TolA-binding protein